MKLTIIFNNAGDFTFHRVSCQVRFFSFVVKRKILSAQYDSFTLRQPLRHTTIFYQILNLPGGKLINDNFIP